MRDKLAIVFNTRLCQPPQPPAYRIFYFKTGVSVHDADTLLSYHTEMSYVNNILMPHNADLADIRMTRQKILLFTFLLSHLDMY